MLPVPSDPGDISKGRLPLDLSPLHYVLEITPDIYSDDPPFSFSGSVSIRFEALATTSEIYLNAFGLDIPQGDIQIQTAPDSPVEADDPVFVDSTVDEEMHFFIISVDEDGIQEGAYYILNMTFSGTMSESGGLRPGTYDYVNGTKQVNN